METTLNNHADSKPPSVYIPDLHVTKKNQFYAMKWETIVNPFARFKNKIRIIRVFYTENKIRV